MVYFMASSVLLLAMVPLVACIGHLRPSNALRGGNTVQVISTFRFQSLAPAR